MKRKEKTRLKIWAFVESVIRSVYWLQQIHIAALGQLVRPPRQLLPLGKPGGWFWAKVLFQVREQAPHVANPLDLWWVQALEINLDFFFLFFKALVCLPLVNTVWFFFPLEEKSSSKSWWKGFLHISFFKTTLWWVKCKQIRIRWITFSF